jgi:hypothetical protein
MSQFNTNINIEGKNIRNYFQNMICLKIFPRHALKKSRWTGILCLQSQKIVINDIGKNKFSFW